MAIEVKAVVFSYVTHVLAIAAAVLVLVLVWTIHFGGGLAWQDSNKNLIFNIHPLLILIGLIIIAGEAIISDKSLPSKKQEKKLIHLVLHGIALILGIIGVYMAFKYHNESNIANMYSLHSWLGIGIISLFGIQWIYGFVVFFYPGGTPLIRKESLPRHVLFGLFVYIFNPNEATKKRSNANLELCYCTNQQELGFNPQGSIEVTLCLYHINNDSNVTIYGGKRALKSQFRSNLFGVVREVRS